ncbi:conserved Plasmodium protein, unknown function [Plasmodium malariae]|uniref:Uncharacterized protein n=1 Tax=Plasmodium malariae TaxID=5858 RepID=A0A1D3PBU5_PLAMA|nr:conserved Plasmodium protein, unknown function [Plasmodium malariae]SCN12762.1 conserved Plasmodium protein, unknown function [Plasmodium malariae]
MNDKNDVEISNSDYVNSPTLKDSNLKESYQTNEFVNNIDSMNSNKNLISEDIDVNDKAISSNTDNGKSTSFFSKCFNKIVNLNKAASMGSSNMNIAKMNDGENARGYDENSIKMDNSEMEKINEDSAALYNSSDFFTNDKNNKEETKNLSMMSNNDYKNETENLSMSNNNNYKEGTENLSMMSNNNYKEGTENLSMVSNNNYKEGTENLSMVSNNNYKEGTENLSMVSNNNYKEGTENLSMVSNNNYKEGTENLSMVSNNNYKEGTENLSMVSNNNYKEGTENLSMVSNNNYKDGTENLSLMSNNNNISSNCNSNSIGFGMFLNSMSKDGLFQDFNFGEMITGMSNFHKNETELNISRGEIYLNECEFVFTTHVLLNSGFRFQAIEDVKKKKRREFFKLEELTIDTKRTKSDSINKIVDSKKEEKSEMDTIGIHVESIKNDGMNYGKSEELIEKEKKIEGKMEANKENGEKGEYCKNGEYGKNMEGKMSQDEKERIEMCDEILMELKNSFYEQILNIENNFKNLDNKIENNNCFSFHCIMEKLKNRKYDNVLLIYNDLYLYLNNLLFLSKPSSYIWMKLHELSSQISNTILNIQQKKEKRFNEGNHLLHTDEIEKKENKKQVTTGEETIEESINEEEKLAFQLLLGKLHQDIHFELFRKFKNKAVWKTLEGGEIELDDKLTKADVFRDMYNWCKLQLELKSKRSDISESESDSSKDSY